MVNQSVANQSVARRGARLDGPRDAAFMTKHDFALLRVRAALELHQTLNSPCASDLDNSSHLDPPRRQQVDRVQVAQDG
jgi:hypothetical protein